jgi:hypothetical protein
VFNATIAGIKVLCYLYSWEVLDRIVPHKYAETKQSVEEHNSYLLKYQSFVETLVDLKNWFNVASQIRMENKDISILFIGRDKYYFIKSRSKANKKSKQNVIIQIWDFDDWKIICPIWWTSVSTNDWYFNRYELCSSTDCFVSVSSEQGQDKKHTLIECRWYNLRLDRTIYQAKAGIKVLCYLYSWEVLDRIVPHKYAFVTALKHLISLHYIPPFHMLS